MTEKYPFLAFTFKGRIKSLIRAEEKFNGYILEFIHEYYKANGKYPNEAQIKNNLNCFRDLIAYRIVISLPQCHVMDGENLEDEEIKYLYDIANVMPGFLEERGFTAELSGFSNDEDSECISENNRMYYRDYVKTPRPTGYRSLHITFYDNFARCYTEVQLRTKDMDDQAEIGRANHFGYEKEQEENRSKRDMIPEGECKSFDEAYERLIKLQELDLSSINVNMFKAYNNQLINDGCGLFRGRQILPFEHLSRFQDE
jgi:Guanosine polyphosphate pyrophosphohydrolases/synthetases